MRLTGPNLIKIDQITVASSVRLSLDQDNVLYLAELYESGVKIEPIIVMRSKENKDQFEVVEGRHRLEALKLLGKTETMALISSTMEFDDVMFEAMRANLKGPKPPTPADITYVVQQLLAAGVTKVKIRECMPFPKSMIERHILSAAKRINRKQLGHAIEEMVKSGISVAKAAAMFKVSEQDIKDVLSKRKAGTENISSIFASLETRNRSLGQRMATTSRIIIAGMSNGEFSEKDVQKYVARLKDTAARVRRHVENICQRIEAADKTPGSFESED